ncbi:MAG: hypothetical protein AMJ91_00645 [candidate division Zixibacteria bacterium SM23_73_3]|nr:MAG: hypothetical protein AMJ91_00645 [candidate division Zixibacteria bacterium SM23_73_3]
MNLVISILDMLIANDVEVYQYLNLEEYAIACHFVRKVANEILFYSTCDLVLKKLDAFDEAGEVDYFA